MAKNGTTVEERNALDDETDDRLRSLVDRGRSLAGRLPDAVDEARSALDTAQEQMDLLSDRGVIAAVGFSAGVLTGLFLAGAPRLVLAASAVPLVITVRSALTRGVRLSRLVN